MLITSESKRDLIHFVCLPKLRDSVLVNFNYGDFKIDNITYYLVHQSNEIPSPLPSFFVLSTNLMLE